MQCNAKKKKSRIDGLRSVGQSKESVCGGSSDILVDATMSKVVCLLKGKKEGWMEKGRMDGRRKDGWLRDDTEQGKGKGQSAAASDSRK